METTNLGIAPFVRQIKFIPFIDEADISDEHLQAIIKYHNKYHTQNVPCVSVYLDNEEFGIILFTDKEIKDITITHSCLTKDIKFGERETVSILH